MYESNGISKKIINLLDNETTQPSGFRTKKSVEVNDDRLRIYNAKILKFMTTLLKSSLCDYNYAYIFVKETKTVNAAGPNAKAITADRNNKQISVLSFENLCQDW